MLRLGAGQCGHAVDDDKARPGLASTVQGFRVCRRGLSKRCGSMDVDGLHHWYPAIEIDRLSCPRSLPNRYDQHGVGAVVIFSLEVRSWLKAHIRLSQTAVERRGNNAEGIVRKGCSGNNDVLHEASLVGRMAKGRFGRRGRRGRGRNLCCLWSWEVGACGACGKKSVIGAVEWNLVPCRPPAAT